MTSINTLLNFSNLQIVSVAACDERITIQLTSASDSCLCPVCGTESVRYHSSYNRSIQDTPIGLKTVWLQVAIRRFRCVNRACGRQTFAEQHPLLVERRKRRTNRLLGSLAEIGLALGGEAGARLAKILSMAASGSTLLRLLHQLDVPSPKSPKVIGIDDWAFRKGTTYGTVIVDHESGKAIDLLPSRDGDTVRAWLETQPTVSVVTRDRSGEFREAITQAAPEAIQVADRWHLLRNLHDVIHRYIGRNHGAIKEQLTQLVLADNEADGSVVIASKQPRYDHGPARDALHVARVANRQALFDKAKAMRADGVYLKDIAKHLGMCRQQVARWLEWNTLHPDMRGRHTKHGLIDPYIEYLRQRLDEGCTNQSQLWREICAQGFSGCRTLVGRWIRQQAKMAKVREKATSKITIPSTTELSWLMFHTPERLTDEQNQWLARLRANEQIDILYEQAHQFIKMVRKRLGSDWQEWLQNAKQSAIKEVVNFAIGLARDSEAVHQALIQPYSNGRTEGHVNRLKFIKRQMYGRASFKLLRIRVLLSQK